MDLNEKRSAVYNAYVLDQELNKKRQEFDAQVKKEQTEAENRGYNRYVNNYNKASRINTSRRYASRRARPILIAFVVLGVIFMLLTMISVVFLVFGIIFIILGIVLSVVVTNSIVRRNRNAVVNFEKQEEKNKQSVANELDNIELKYLDQEKKLLEDYKTIIAMLQEEQNESTGQKQAKIVDNGMLDDLFKYLEQNIDTRPENLNYYLVDTDFVNNFTLRIAVSPTYIEFYRQYNEKDINRKLSSLRYVFMDHGLNNLPDYATQRAVAFVVGRFLFLRFLENFPKNRTGLFNHYTFSTQEEPIEENRTPRPDYDLFYGIISVESVKEKPEW